MIMGIVTTTAAAAFAAVCAYLDFKWVTRILDMLEDQGTARKICDAMLERDESSRLLTWKDIKVHPKSDYFWRLRFVDICADSFMAQVELVGLMGVVALQAFIAFCIGSSGFLW